MAAAATTLLALCALLAGASADDHCTTKSYGDTSGTAVPLTPVPLPPPTLEWDIKTNADSACPSTHAVGLTVTACDPDGPPAPSVNILSVQEILVKRVTAAQTEGFVDITAYCTPNFRSLKQPRVVDGVEEVRGRGVIVGVGGRGVITAVPLN